MRESRTAGVGEPCTTGVEGVVYGRCEGSHVQQMRGVMYSRCEANPDVRGVVHSRLRESCKEMWGSHVQHV